MFINANSFYFRYHGNLPALKAAMADAQTQGASKVICSGDVIGYGPSPSEVCAFLENNNILTISGNYDCKVLNSFNRVNPLLLKCRKKRENC